MTNDGRYIVCVANQKVLRLVRYCDGKVLAMYTMYDTVCSLSTSSDSCYVIVGTTDKRLFTLIIADHDEKEHDNRITYARLMNPGLSKEHALALMGEANEMETVDSDEDGYDSSDDEAIMRAAEKRLDRRRDKYQDVIFCLLSDEESSASSSDDSRPHTRQVYTRESTMFQAYENSLQPTAHDGEIFTPSPCSLQ